MYKNQKFPVYPFNTPFN